MKYAYTILYVENVSKTVQFYKNAFGFDEKFITPENDYAELLSGETTIAFASHTLAKSNFSNKFSPVSHQTPPPAIELAFTSENINEDFEKALKNGAREFEPIVEKPWGQKVGYVRDLNGFIIEICTPMSSK